MKDDHLKALLAIVDHGTFEAAARALSVTPSAVSQRVRALESEVGHVVIRRTTPCTPTDSGAVLVRLARQRQLLDEEAEGVLSSDPAARVDLPLAVNADSLATWFVGVLEGCAAWTDTVVRLHVEDEAHSSELLRSGSVIGAVTSDPVAVQGCSVEQVGRMRYVPVATPELAAAFAKGRGVDWSAMPTVRFNAKDDLQQRLLDHHGATRTPPTHLVPSSEGFLAAVHAGLGWGAVPEEQLGDDLGTGRLVRLGTRSRVDVPLYWQRWRLQSDRVERISELVRRVAASALRR
ncbi:LysR family transcriptional regulator ArgP [Luteipulveratus mongoliensis]|uniref:LysR family transcriptional regulator n=1 Tax=Luteipulveratus mongoliensis TaxID=571913 RepID=A0A0K1JEP8_9MICO|nr:LysR family transcriptional regulator ArgP [Luteipulveratus mongoliensis]AKU15176.1 LysR family transcriptional regulator [Luteipulveratus mongoliensis]